MASDDQIITEVEGFYRGYIEAFNREDAERFNACFELPYSQLDGRLGLIVVAKAEDHARFFRRLMDSLHKRGWTHTQIDLMRIWPLADDLAMLQADYSRRRKDESVLEQGRAAYIIRKQADLWKIISMFQIKGPFRGPGDIPRTG